MSATPSINGTSPRTSEGTQEVVYVIQWKALAPDPIIWLSRTNFRCHLFLANDLVLGPYRVILFDSWLTYCV